MWQRGIPLLLSDQFIPNEQMATNQCNSGGEGERARQFCEILGLAVLHPPA